MAGDGRQVSVLGVPTSAGSHNPGQDRAPAAGRAVGLIGALEAAGLDVEDRGDLPATPYRPVEPEGGLRDEDRGVDVGRRGATAGASGGGAWGVGAASSRWPGGSRRGWRPPGRPGGCRWSWAATARSRWGRWTGSARAGWCTSTATRTSPPRSAAARRWPTPWA